MMDDLRSSFGPEALRRLAWGRSFERGEGYAAEGRVRRLEIGGDQLSATVRGMHTYRVRLWLEDGEPRFSCTCPVAGDGLFCKHCVAVGLAAFDTDLSGGAAVAPSGDIGVCAYLEGLEKSRLVDLLLEQAAADELLQGRLELAAAAASAGSTEGAGERVAGYRRVIRDVICPGDFIGYRSMYDYSRGIDALTDSFEALLADGFAAEVIDLCEHALTCLEDALGAVDDSDGTMGDIRDRLVTLHHEACVQARPDQVALAERLFEWELHSDWEIFLGAAAQYADVLGEAGLAAYRRRAEEVWARTPALAAGADAHHSTSRFVITHIMETLAGLSQDVGALAAVKARDLSSPYRFLQIAEAHAAAGRHDDVLAWLEQGLAAYPECTDVRLLEMLAGEYQRRGRGQDAAALTWSLLERLPTLGSYQLLKAHAEPAGEWGERRGRALDSLRRSASAQVVPGWGRTADHSEVVKALLWEGRCGRGVGGGTFGRVHPLDLDGGGGAAVGRSSGGRAAHLSAAGREGDRPEEQAGI
jgi:tetratricopeptide (TPR) repeat protein